MSKKKDRINRMLKGLPAPAAKPLLASAVTALIAALASRLEEPLRDLIEAKADKAKAAGKKPTEPVPTAH